MITVEDARFARERRALQTANRAIRRHCRVSNPWRTTSSIRSHLVFRSDSFGIGMNNDHTLEEVGQRFSVSRERIRQTEAKALRKLKHPSRSRILRSFLDN